MFESLKKFWTSQRIKQLTDIRNIVLYIFALIVLAIAWSTAKAVEDNYQLQKQISVIKQQNDVLGLENTNSALNNKYLQTDEYLELSARQNLGLAAPGETVMLVPKNVAMKYIDKSLTPQAVADSNAAPKDDRPGYIKNMDDWRNFLLGRKLFDNNTENN